MSVLKFFTKASVILYGYVFWTGIRAAYAVIYGTEPNHMVYAYLFAFFLYATTSYFALRGNRVCQWFMVIVLLFQILTVCVGIFCASMDQIFVKIAFILGGSYFFTGGLLFLRQVWQKELTT